jgi:hypothetical protein
VGDDNPWNGNHVDWCVPLEHEETQMNLSKWLRDKKRFRLQAELAKVSAKIRIWQPFLRDPDGVDIYVIERLEEFSARKALLEAKLEALK